MNEQKLSEFYSDESKNYHSSTDILRFLLIPFVFFVLLGFPGKYGGYISIYSNFVAQAFFILYGFFTLVPDKDKRDKKLKKAFKRSFKFFAIMILSYLALNILYLAYFNALPSLLNPEFLRKRTFFNFLVLNIWPLPVGNSIWFIQSLVYAYAFFLIAEKIKLNKLYIPILIILIIFTLLTGELAAFFGFPHFGYSYIPAGAFTRAIPYMLIGMFIRSKVDILSKIPRFTYWILFIVGLLAAIAEIEVLSRIGKLTYTGHTVGFGIMAISLCCFAISRPVIKKNFLSYHGRSYSKRMYAFCQPAFFVCWIFTALINPALVGIVRAYGSIISFALSFLITFIIGIVRYAIVVEKNKKEKLHNLE